MEKEDVVEGQDKVVEAHISNHDCRHIANENLDLQDVPFGHVEPHLVQVMTAIPEEYSEDPDVKDDSKCVQDKECDFKLSISVRVLHCLIVDDCLDE